jgi:ribosomal-protein-alanine N-acetyltransferase
VAALEASLQLFPWSRVNFEDSLTAGYRTWVLRLGGDLIGFSVVMSVIDEAHLLTIGVCKRYQGQGYGARMLRHAMECARLGGAAKLFLEVRPSNERAVELYRHFGFHQIGTRKDYYPALAGREDALIFDKELA